jgi:hypothetical protein
MPSSQEPILAIARFNSDNVHHAQILVAEDVTVEDEVAKIIPTEVDTERDRGTRR